MPTSYLYCQMLSICALVAMGSAGLSGCSKQTTPAPAANNGSTAPNTSIKASGGVGDGTYHIKSAASEMLWRIRGGEQKAHLHLFTDAGSDYYDTEVTFTGYLLQWKHHNNYCLEYDEAGGDHPVLRQDPCTDDNNQGWLTYRTGSYWAIKNIKWNNQCITRPKNAEGTGVEMMLAPCTGSFEDPNDPKWIKEQQWTFQRIADSVPETPPKPSPKTEKCLGRYAVGDYPVPLGDYADREECRKACYVDQRPPYNFCAWGGEGLKKNP